MPVHVSVRLFWHDNGWDGAICRDPAANTWCEAHDHVRDHKSPDESKENVRGKPVREAGVPPGCEVSIQAFSRRRNEIRVWPPDWMTASGVNPVDLELQGVTTGMWPYEEMWTEDGGFKNNDERRAIAESFFEQVEEGKSLAFFYVDERNPLFIEDGERSPHRVLVGISRITSYEKQIQEWVEPTYGGETNMVWSVPFKHAYPKDGVRLPVQALQSAVADPDERAQYLVPLEGGIRTDFRYGSSRVSLDRSVAVIERAIAALGRIRADGVIETSVEKELEWLNSILLELWEDRGPYPGIAPLLTMLGCSRAAEIASKALGSLAAEGRDAAEVLFAALDGEVDETLSDFEDEVGDAADEWEYWDKSERELARLLVRMELETDQMRLIAGSPDSRERHGLPGNAADVTANPYLICERFRPLRDGEPVSFLTVDHGLVPHESMAPLGEHRVQRRDPRRLRALLCEELSARAEDGHTFLNAAETLAAATARSPEDRPCDVPLARLAHEKVAPVVEHAIERFEIDGEPQLALHEIRESEKQIRNSFDELVARPPNESPGVDWQEVSDRLAEESGDPRVELSDEQRDALERTFRSPLSVLTGAAGTGKSTLLAPLIAAIRGAEGAAPAVALTPTGKAADRLVGIGVEAMTIHRALAMAGWFDFELGIWVEGDKRVEAETLIIDECSMVDINLLAMLFRALDWNGVRRLVLVGDHHQLPPIGPGRPFFDLIAVMQAADESDGGPSSGRLSELTHNYRVDEGSSAIAFANSFARQAEPDEALIWEAVAKGNDVNDLRVHFWDEPEELHEQLLAEIEALVQRDCEEAGLELDGGRAFNATIGHGEDSPYGPAHWQVLAPMRGSAHGTRKLNALIQDQYHGWAKRARRAPNGAYIRWPVKFGQEQITAFDKVMQVSNERLPVWRPGVKFDPDAKKERIAVFNGQIGIVRGEWPSSNQRFRKGPKQKGQVKRISVELDGVPGVRFDYWKSGWPGVDQNLELAYAVTVHKGQGSQFRHVFFVVPQEAAQYFGRELTYTGLTRAESTLTLFVERDMASLLSLRKLAAAQTPQRNSRLFEAQIGTMSYRAGKLVYGTNRGDRVASKGEVIIHNLLYEYEKKEQLSFAYEEELFGPSGNRWDFRLPDFTVRVGGETYYWEHCGMMDDPIYQEKWERVRLPWYKRNGFEDRLIVTEDGPTNPMDSGRIEQEVIQGRLLTP